MKTVWNDTVIAESENAVIVEGNQYFPPSSVNPAFLKPNWTTSVCSWKGVTVTP